MKILAVGWNYPKHNAELGESVVRPTNPTIFSMPETALLKDNSPFYLPDFSNDIQYETEVVVRIEKMGKNISKQFANRYYNSVTLGIDFTARDLQNELKAKGLPWDICKGFDNAAPIGEFIPKEKLPCVDSLNFYLDLNGNRVQNGCTQDMFFSVDEIIAYVSRFFTLKTGDLIFTGTPNGVGPVHVGDRLTGVLEGNKLLDFEVL